MVKLQNLAVGLRKIDFRATMSIFIAKRFTILYDFKTIK